MCIKLRDMTKLGSTQKLEFDGMNSLNSYAYILHFNNKISVRFQTFKLKYIQNLHNCIQTNQIKLYFRKPELVPQW